MFVIQTNFTVLEMNDMCVRAYRGKASSTVWYL
jgi:hypothetical protein